MAHCFQLYKIGSTEPAVFQQIDADMCAAFSVPCDPTEWYANWYNYIGLLLAVGKSFDEIREHINEEIRLGEERERADIVEHWTRKLDVCNWLQANYTSNAWREPGFAH